MAPISLSTPFAVSAKSQPAPSRLEERGSQVNVTSTYSHSEKDNTGNLVDEERNPMSNFWVAVCIIA
ncbi:BZ3501_MvSof-1269-A2-R1_Chr12-3g03611 [Microbotryum saponariae]|nr:BZ3501_MvSof-1269-A2-R1_Chr12-3g03611 [Microbotryum saponariae]